MTTAQIERSAQTNNDLSLVGSTMQAFKRGERVSLSEVVHARRRIHSALAADRKDDRRAREAAA